MIPGWRGGADDDSRDVHPHHGAGLASTDGEQPDTLSVFMCGPAGMTRKFQAEFRRAGIPRRHIYREHFDWRLGPAPQAAIPDMTHRPTATAQQAHSRPIETLGGLAREGSKPR
jgi:ferredoxin-NADP reductase